ncbi:MAG: LAGLIDADG family homing endonuclease [Candidatus Uhrbacteria bacterium]|nr:LAGLIDADG family homing endonuclease [Candidatus Uhrbacteria bacterium]
MAFRPITRAAKKAPAQEKKALARQEEEELKTTIEEELAYRRGLIAVKDLISPASFEVEPSYIRIGSRYARTVFVVGYPRYINVGWFAPIINYAATFDISIFFSPLATPLVLKQLRNKVGRVEAEISSGQEKGKPRDPMAETALRDMERLRDDLTQGIEHFFTVGVYMTLYANSLEELDKLTEDIEGLFGSKLIFTKRVLYQAEQGFNSTLPLCNDEISIGFNMNTSPSAAAFPFISSDLTSDNGILYGINRHNNSLILFDRFSMQNANEVVFATSGAGKSIVSSSDVLIKDADGIIKLVQIGPYIDSLAKTHVFEKIDEELEGVVDPGIQVYSFTKDLKGEWSPVSIAARKDAPDDLFVFTMKSGREITVTGDHNMLVLRDGKVVADKSVDISVGESIPLPRHISEPEQPVITQDIYELFRSNPRVYVEGGSQIIARHYKQLTATKIDPRLDRYLYKYRTGRRIPLVYFTRVLDCLGIEPQVIYSDIRLCSKTTSLKETSLTPVMRLTPEWSRLMGYIVSEGAIREHYILISNEDETVVDDIIHCLNVLGFSFYRRKDDGSFVIAGRVIVEYIKALGIGRTSGDKRVPGVLFGAPSTLIAEFLKAYFEGDGCVENHAVTATSKSKRLVSDLSYLFFRFGIHVRLSRKIKYASNTKKKIRRTYWQLSLSGQENLTRYSESIRFVTQRKNARLWRLLGMKSNTNSDTIPVQAVFQELYTLFPSHLRGIQDCIELKNGSYQPSREKLRAVIEKVNEAVGCFEKLRGELEMLTILPHLTSVVGMGVCDKNVNSVLWKEMGHTWNNIKQQRVSPHATNVLKAWSYSSYNTIDFDQVKSAVHHGFRALNLSMNDFNRSLRTSLCERDDMRYGRLRSAAQYVMSEYQRVALHLPRVRDLIATLQNLCYADLMWDSIASIKKIQNVDRYVYDLTVDNEVFLAGHGGLFVHNSFAIKLEILRSMMMGTDIMVIDPEREYKHLCDAVGGTYVNISLSSTSRINPFDLPRPVGEQVSTADIIRSAVITLKGLMRLMLGAFSQEEDSTIDRALLEAYAKKDITPQTDLSAGVEPPTLSDLQDVLDGMEGGAGLSAKLKKYTEGTFAGLLNKPTNVETKNQLVVFSVRDLEDELRPIAIYTIINYIWNVVRSQIKRRILVIDEAWWLMQHEDSARFIFALAKRCRKYYLGVTTITQDVNDFLNSQYGRAILTNSAIQLLLKQSSAAIDVVQKTFLLTEGEKYLLLEGGPGEGIFFAGSKHGAIKVVASYSEDQLITTDPRQLLEIEAAKKEFEEEKGQAQNQPNS